MKKIRKLYGNENGATSVLILFMMIVLVTLGTFSITSANVNLKFGRKTVDMTAVYYALDAEGERYISDLDNALAQAQADAFSYMKDKAYEKNTAESLPATLQHAVYNGAADGAMDSETIFNTVYLYMANEKIEQLAEKYPGSVISRLEQGEKIAEITAETSIPSDKDANMSLSIGAMIQPLSIETDAATGEITGRLTEGEQRFIIDLWEQKRTPFDYESAPGIWDGVLS
ncbi:MAG: hypothetical protein LBU77_01290 [Clostridiales bacterium]|jgi:hypothetical protein|nr:hypothetical protein [Clostridiales bacterium]